MAAELCPTDPSIHNEMGTTRYKEQNYQEAKVHFMKALDLCKEGSNRTTKTARQTQESILINLAHCQRKLKEF